MGHRWTQMDTDFRGGERGWGERGLRGDKGATSDRIRSSHGGWRASGVQGERLGCGAHGWREARC
jgi:hypothetical protein